MKIKHIICLLFTTVFLTSCGMDEMIMSPPSETFYLPYLNFFDDAEGIEAERYTKLNAEKPTESNKKLLKEWSVSDKWTLKNTTSADKTLKLAYLKNREHSSTHGLSLGEIVHIDGAKATVYEAYCGGIDVFTDKLTGRYMDALSDKSYINNISVSQDHPLLNETVYVYSFAPNDPDAYRNDSTGTSYYEIPDPLDININDTAGNSYEYDPLHGIDVRFQYDPNSSKPYFLTYYHNQFGSHIESGYPIVEYTDISGRREVSAKTGRHIFLDSSYMKFIVISGDDIGSSAFSAHLIESDNTDEIDLAITRQEMTMKEFLDYIVCLKYEFWETEYGAWSGGIHAIFDENEMASHMDLIHRTFIQYETEGIPAALISLSPNKKPELCNLFNGGIDVTIPSEGRVKYDDFTDWYYAGKEMDVSIVPVRELDLLRYVFSTAEPMYYFIELTLPAGGEVSIEFEINYTGSQQGVYQLMLLPPGEGDAVPNEHSITVTAEGYYVYGQNMGLKFDENFTAEAALSTNSSDYGNYYLKLETNEPMPHS